MWYTTIEVPPNSPKPFESIGRLTNHFRLNAQIGAGTVLNVKDVQRVVEVGGQLIVWPDTAKDVIQATKAANLASLPVVMTPTDCITTSQNRADGLKFFP